MGKSLVLFVGGILTALANKLLAGGLSARIPWFTQGLLDLAVARLPEDQRERFAEEWASHLDETPEDTGKVVIAWGCVFAARKMGPFAARGRQETTKPAKPTDRKTPSHVLAKPDDLQLSRSLFKSKLSEKFRAISNFTLFADVTPAEFEAIISQAREKRFCRRETIYNDGDPVRQVTMLLSGFVKVTQRGVNGNEVILRLNGAGEILGSYRVCVNSTHCSTAQAVQPCVALVWNADVFERLQARIPVFRRNSVRALEERLQDMEQRFREVSTEKVGSRLSSELVRISDRLRRTDGILEITLSREELARLTGATLFTVSRLLCHWQNQGIVRIRDSSEKVGERLRELVRLSDRLRANSDGSIEIALSRSELAVLTGITEWQSFWRLPGRLLLRWFLLLMWKLGIRMRRK